MTQKHYHFIGIGGIGMSGLAKILISKGFQVSGSDIHNNHHIECLRLRGCPVFIQHSPSNILNEVTDVVYSSSIKQDNCELQEAIKRGLNTIHRGDLLSEIVSLFPKSIGVVGTHGKTTTSSILTEIYRAHKPTSYIIGGMLNSSHLNADYESDETVIVELDESDGSFLKSHVSKAIITNIDLDHMDFYKCKKNLIHSFSNFISHFSKIKSNLIYCADNEILKELNPEGISYGYSPHSDAHIHNFRSEETRSIFDITYDNKTYKDIELNLLGEFNTLNATAAFLIALHEGICENIIRHTLSTFKGVGRRQQIHRIENNIVVINDYAHHPYAISQTLHSIKKSLPNRRLIACVQPHRYSRLKFSYNDFIQALKPADKIYITDIYSAGEDPATFNISGDKLVKDINTQNNFHMAEFCEVNKLESHISMEQKPNDVFVLMGAGSIDSVFKHITENSPSLQKEPPINKLC